MKCGPKTPTPAVIHGLEMRTSDALDMRARCAARGLQALGVEEGATIAMVLRNCIVSLEMMRAADLCGAYLVPVNWHLTDRELEHILVDSGAIVIVCGAEFLERITALRPGVRCIVAGARAGPGDSWENLALTGPPVTGDPVMHRSNIVYTSGTTGTPKGVVRAPVTAAQRQGQLTIARQVYGIGDGALRTIICGPLYHGAPNFIATSALAVGGLIVLVDRFDPEELLQLIERHHITHLHLVPTMMVRLLNLSADVRQRHDLSSLKFVCHAAAPCPPAIKQAMIAWFGLIVHEYYGGTETGPAVFCRAEEALRHPGSVGRPLPGVELAILDSEGALLPPGVAGEIFIANSLFPDFTYRNRPDERRAIERDGKVTVGDIGYVDDDGFLYLCDRTRDMYISGGVNIYSVEIENEILSLDGVRDCAVFGIPDKEMGEVGCALVVLEDGASLNPSAIQVELQRTLARYKIPRRIEIRPSLPREDSGKLFKRQLREPFWRSAGRQI